MAGAPSSLRHLCFTLAQLGQRGEWDGRWSPSGLGMRCSEKGKGLTRYTLPGLRARGGGVEGIEGECGKFSSSRATPGEGLGVPGKPADEDRVQISETVPALPRSDPSLTSRR